MQPNSRWVLYSLILIFVSVLTALGMLLYPKYKSYANKAEVSFSAEAATAKAEKSIPVSASVRQTDSVSPSPADTADQLDKEDEWEESQLTDGGILVRPETAFVRLSQQTEELLQKIFPKQESTYLTNHLLYHPETALPSQDYFVKKLAASRLLPNPQQPVVDVLQQLDELVTSNKQTLDKAVKYYTASHKRQEQLFAQKRIQTAALPSDTSPDDYFATLPQEQQQWLRTMPLYKDNLAFSSKSGNAPQRIDQTPCPDVMQGVVLKNIFCQTAWYSSGAKSIFYFQNNVLQGRDDYHADGTLATRYLFLPPPARHITEGDFFEASKAGAVYTAEFYTPQGTLRAVYFYKPDRTINLLVENLFDKHLQTKYSYDDNHHFSSFFSVDSIDGTLSSIHTTHEIRIHEDDTNQKSGTYSSSEIFMGESTVSNGTWTADDRNFIQLDNGRRFPPADYYSKAPTYCQLYPADCKTEK